MVGGTSLSVYPAAGFIGTTEGIKWLLSTKATTPYDKEADLLIQTGLGEVFLDIAADNAIDTSI